MHVSRFVLLSLDCFDEIFKLGGNDNSFCSLEGVIGDAAEGTQLLELMSLNNRDILYINRDEWVSQGNRGGRSVCGYRCKALVGADVFENLWNRAFLIASFFGEI